MLSLIQFSSRGSWHNDTWYQRWHDALPIDAMPKLTDRSYTCDGGTALLDALGKAIDETGLRLAKLSEESRPAKVVFVVITDGEENSSTTFTKAQIREMIAHQEGRYQWGFSFLGCGFDAFAEAGSIGVSIGTTTFVANNQFAYGNAWQTIGGKLGMTRSAGMNIPVAATMTFNAQDAQLMNVQTAEQDAKLKADLNLTDDLTPIDSTTTTNQQ